MTSLLPNNAHMDYVLSLADIPPHDAERAGAKAAKLGELARAGFPVPDGFVLTTDAFDRFLAALALGPDISPEAVIAATLPTDVAAALLAAADVLGDIPLAVRSSGVAEDPPEASFAGQYETVLDVRGREALIAAVQRVFASAFSRPATVYRAAQGQHARDHMAVLVQCMVTADAAGVAFTANPVTGDRAEMIISAVRGSGERLVSGQATPDEWIVRDQMERRKLWQRQRRLTPPLVLGEMTLMMKRIFERSETMLRPQGRLSVGKGLAGLPASPGRASGPARVIRAPEEFDRLQPGDVLIAPVTTPAWTLLFARAAAVVTDTGSPLAHASLAAREYGIPAVVGTGNATARLQDGQIVTVDGNTGLVEVQG